MIMSKILRFTFVLLLIKGSLAFPLRAQTEVADSLSNAATQVKGIQYSPSDGNNVRTANKSIPLFSGFSVTADMAGAVMALASPYGQYEGAFRLHLHEKYFPVFEYGWGVSDHIDETTEIRYTVSAPYFRIGCDYNFMKDKMASSRILAGVRYAFTAFKYDLEGPSIVDPIYGTETPFSYNNISSNAHWMEFVFGLETRIYRIFSLGWTFRYRLRLSEKKPWIGNSWYVPGYGRTGGTALGGTFNLIVNI